MTGKFHHAPMSKQMALQIRKIAEAIGDSPTIAELRHIREQLDSWLFRENVRQTLSGINSPERIAEIRDSLRHLQRKAEEILGQRDNQRETLRLLGLGGGAGIAGGALVTAMTIAVPAIAIIPVAAGVFMMWRAESSSRSMTEEIRLFEQIADIARQLAES